MPRKSGYLLPGNHRIKLTKPPGGGIGWEIWTYDRTLKLVESTDTYARYDNAVRGAWRAVDTLNLDDLEEKARALIGAPPRPLHI